MFVLYLWNTYIGNFNELLKAVCGQFESKNMLVVITLGGPHIFTVLLPRTPACSHSKMLRKISLWFWCGMGRVTIVEYIQTLHNTGLLRRDKNLRESLSHLGEGHFSDITPSSLSISSKQLEKLRNIYEGQSPRAQAYEN